METIMTLTKQEMEQKIIDHIQKDNVNDCKVEFIFSPGENNGIDLFVITHNPIHNTPFLFEKTWAVTEELALANILKWIEHPVRSKNEYTFTVEWKKHDEPTNKSYFSGADIYDVLDKFYHNKDSEHYTIYNIKLNPIS